MALNGDTGNGATLTLPGGLSLAIISIAPGAKSIEAIDSSVLATTGPKEMIPGDLADVAEFTATFKWVQTVAEPTLGTVATCTVTFPIGPGLTVAATYSGTGFIKSWKPPDFANNQLLVGEIKFQFDGDTGPTYTVGS